MNAAGWPTRMSKPFAAKGVGACLKHVLNTRLPPATPRPTGEAGMGEVQKAIEDVGELTRIGGRANRCG